MIGLGPAMSEVKILLVEDDTSLGETLQERLQKESYKVSWAQSCKQALENLKNEKYQIAILDIGLPDGSGFDLAKSIRDQQNIPFLFMTAMNTAENRLEGYEIGADEFIPKPFHLKELLMRVQHVISNHVRENLIRVGGLSLDLEKMSMTDSSGKITFIATRDFQVLNLLISHAPKAVSRDEILDLVWGEDQFPTARTVDNCILRLRQLFNDNQGEIIRSVRGIGYQWILPASGS